MTINSENPKKLSLHIFINGNNVKIIFLKFSRVQPVDYKKEYLNIDWELID